MRSLYWLAPVVSVAVGRAAPVCRFSLRNATAYKNSEILETIENVTADECCDLCATKAGCVGWTLRQDQSKCRLRSKLGDEKSCSSCTSGVPSPPPSPPAPPPTPWPADCSYSVREATGYTNSKMIRSFDNASLEDCCAQCAAETFCVAWTLNSGTCHLRSFPGDATSCSTCTSAVWAPTPPAPSPTPAPPAPLPVGAPQVILTILMDDLGWYDTQVTNPESPTPNIGRLAAEGLRLNRHYVYQYCSPTRRSFLSGRFPVHISNAQADVCSNWLPLNFTILSEKLKQRGFACHFVGKGHLGYQTEDHLPINRGFDSHAGYLYGMEKYEHGDHSVKYFLKDFWVDSSPSPDAAQDIYYSTNWYTERAVRIIKEHPKDQPLWLHLPYQSVHAPFEEPPEWEQIPMRRKFCGGSDLCKVFGDMLNVVDSGIGNVTNALKDVGLWEKTLVIYTSDNGGAKDGPQNNYPLRGHKHTSWEGGIRVQALVGGGFLPQHLRGTSSDAFVHIADWYATLSSLVGVDPSDADRAVADIDGVNVWPMLIGENATNPREYLPVTEHAIIYQQRWKLITNAQAAYWYTPNSSHIPCGACKGNCLFDIVADEGEHHDVAGDHPELVKQLSKQLHRYKVYTQPSMSAAELAEYHCVTPGGGDPDAAFDGWPWGPPHYQEPWAGVCCFRKQGTKLLV